jgi:hypothetical protein
MPIEICSWMPALAYAALNKNAMSDTVTRTSLDVVSDDLECNLASGMFAVFVASLAPALHYPQT